MNHNKHELTHKKYIVAEKRLNVIYKKIRNLPYTKLDKPYQRGWNLIPVLREDFLRSARGPIVKALFDKFGVSVPTNSSKLITKIRKKPTLDNVINLLTPKGRRYWYAYPHLRPLTKKEYDSLNEQERKYFSRIALPWYMTSKYYQGNIWYGIDIPPHYIQIKVEKRIITHKQEIDPLLLQEQAELKKILEPYWRSSNWSRERWENYFENRRNRRQSKVDLSKLDINET